jgi:hypothetical protein
MVRSIGPLNPEEDWNQLAKALLQRVATTATYKPGYRFLVRDAGLRQALVSVQADDLIDSRDSESTIRITINVMVNLSEVRSSTDALRHLARAISAFELHESTEWFKLHGKTVFLPHDRGDEFGHLSWPTLEECAPTALNPALELDSQD